MNNMNSNPDLVYPGFWQLLMLRPTLIYVTQLLKQTDAKILANLQNNLTDYANCVYLYFQCIQIKLPIWIH